MKVEVREITKGCKFEYISKGDFIDLIAAEDIILKAPQAGTLRRKMIDGVETSHRDVIFDTTLIPLGIAMSLPDGFEATIVPRSSTLKKYGIIQANHVGIVDSSYRGNNDEWKMPVIALRDTVIHKGDRICQFRIRLSQKAKWWQKLVWLFSNEIHFEWVDKLNDEDRGGFGTTN